jgi:hypothetical protein
MLVAAGEAWARSRGGTEMASVAKMASDAKIDNAVSILLHSRHRLSGG